MKNQMLVSKLKDLKKEKSFTSIEGTVLRKIRGGYADPCGTKCKPNSACNGNTQND